MNQPLFSRTFTKDEALNREKYILIENSDVPADQISIKNAIDKAMAEMQEQLGSYSRTKQE